MKAIASLFDLNGKVAFGFAFAIAVAVLNGPGAGGSGQFAVE